MSVRNESSGPAPVGAMWAPSADGWRIIEAVESAAGDGWVAAAALAELLEKSLAAVYQIAGGLVEFGMLRKERQDGSIVYCSTSMRPRDPDDPSTLADRTRENRLRYRARGQHLRLEKSRSRSKSATGYGTYRLVDTATNSHIVSGPDDSYGLDLDAVEQILGGSQGCLVWLPMGEDEIDVSPWYHRRFDVG